MEQNNLNGNTGNRPEKKFSAGSIHATVWRNEVTSKDGNPTSFMTVTFERNYKDKNGDWKTSSALRINDLPKASLVLNKAYEYMAIGEQ
jgi:hypothetical protein